MNFPRFLYMLYFFNFVKKIFLSFCCVVFFLRISECVFLFLVGCFTVTTRTLDLVHNFLSIRFFLLSVCFYFANEMKTLCIWFVVARFLLAVGTPQTHRRVKYACGWKKNWTKIFKKENKNYKKATSIDTNPNWILWFRVILFLLFFSLCRFRCVSVARVFSVYAFSLHTAFQKFIVWLLFLLLVSVAAAVFDRIFLCVENYSKLYITENFGYYVSCIVYRQPSFNSIFSFLDTLYRWRAPAHSAVSV